MTRPIDMRVRRDSWFLAVVFLIAFCYLGFLIARFAPIFEGMGLPVGVRLIIACGPVAFPLLGVLAAASFVLLDHFFQRQWTQWALMAVFAFIIIWTFKLLVAAPVGGMRPYIQANHRPGVDAGWTLQLAFSGPRSRATQAGC